MSAKKKSLSRRGKMTKEYEKVKCGTCGHVKQGKRIVRLDKDALASWRAEQDKINGLRNTFEGMLGLYILGVLFGGGLLGIALHEFCLKVFTGCPEVLAAIIGIVGYLAVGIVSAFRLPSYISWVRKEWSIIPFQEKQNQILVEQGFEGIDVKKQSVIVKGKGE
jgi:hypothetical protein